VGWSELEVMEGQESDESSENAGIEDTEKGFRRVGDESV
jgi:hypothetical protein